MQGTVALGPDEDPESVGFRLSRQLSDTFGGQALWAGSRWYRDGMRSSRSAEWETGWNGVGDGASRVFLMVRQGALDRLAGRGAAWTGGMVRDGLRLSRLDLYGDDLGPRRPPPDYYAALPAARTRVHARHQMLTVHRAGGATLALGSRSSTRFLRIYAKWDEDGRVRHEVELKSEAAQAAGARLAGGGCGRGRVAGRVPAGGGVGFLTERRWVAFVECDQDGCRAHVCVVGPPGAGSDAVLLEAMREAVDEGFGPGRLPSEVYCAEHGEPRARWTA